jgi:hypothetical protein
MSSQTSTKRATAPEQPAGGTGAGMQPWHLFLIMTLLATAVTALTTRDTRPANVVFMCLTVAAAGFAAWAVYRTVWPLAQPESVESPDVLGGQTRAALEREQALLLRAITELEFDRAMGKVSESDWQEMTSRLRARAIRVAGQLAGGSTAYRDLIDRELKARKASGRGSGRGGPSPSGVGTAAKMLFVVALAGGALVAAPARAQMGGAPGGMPDAKSMSGIPRLDPSLPAGTVSVRLVRGSITNLVTGSPVEFIVDGKSRSATTDVTGHAVVGGLPVGATVRAVATLGGERIDSEEFRIPPDGGMVLVLVASDKAGDTPMARSAVDGTVAIGGQSRVVAVFDDEQLQVFYLFDLLNAGPEVVKTREPLVFDLPSNATGAGLVDGAPQTAVINGTQIVVPGPFPPGVTSVQVAYSMPPSGRVSIRQKLPVAMDQVAVMVEKVGGAVVTSPQFTTIREGDNGGKRFIIGTGPGLPAGGVLAFDINGLPHPATWPRDTALALGFLALAAGAWGAVRTGGRSAELAARQQLEARRERLFGELLAVDAGLQAGQIGADSATDRRGQLMGELERVYGELDTAANAPGGEGSNA